MGLKKSHFFAIIGNFGLLFTLIYVAITNFLLFHILVELFSIIIGFGTFFFLWTARNTIEDDFYHIIGISAFFISFIDLIHSLTYKGMNILTEFDVNLPTQLWIAARGMQALAFLGAIGTISIVKRKPKETLQKSWVKISPYIFYLGLFSVMTIFLMASIFIWSLFPDCYIEGMGLTSFKKVSEYVISTWFLICIILLYKKRKMVDPKTKVSLITALGLLISSELLFTFYIDVFGISNILGHIFKLYAFFFIFKAILEIGIRRPLNSVYHSLQQRETELRKTLSEVKTLSGLLPICASCKNIRDDQGYWHKVENYINSRTDVSFSHGLCPICAEKYLEQVELDISELQKTDK